jgi:hypothetical protein
MSLVDECGKKSVTSKGKMRDSVAFLLESSYSKRDAAPGAITRVVGPLGDNASTAAAYALGAFVLLKAALLVSVRYCRSARTLPPELLLLYTQEKCETFIRGYLKGLFKPCCTA